PRVALWDVDDKDVTSNVTKVTREGHERATSDEDGGGEGEEERHALLSVPSPPPPQGLCSDLALQGIVNVFNFLVLVTGFLFSERGSLDWSGAS
ncbi:unnamed protein product, partial [Ixodes pacificus]